MPHIPLQQTVGSKIYTCRKLAKKCESMMNPARHHASQKCNQLHNVLCFVFFLKRPKIQALSCHMIAFLIDECASSSKSVIAKKLWRTRRTCSSPDSCKLRECKYARSAGYTVKNSEAVAENSFFLRRVLVMDRPKLCQRRGQLISFLTDVASIYRLSHQPQEKKTT